MIILLYIPHNTYYDNTIVFVLLYSTLINDYFDYCLMEVIIIRQLVVTRSGLHAYNRTEYSFYKKKISG